LVVIAILNSVLSLAVYLRVIVVMYQSADSGVMPRANAAGMLVWSIAMAVTLGLGLFSRLIIG
jgi:NADH-quinone oxidoreductase subunit N